MPTILICTDHPVLGEGLARVLARSAEGYRCVLCRDIVTLRASLLVHRPAVTILDHSLEAGNDLNHVREFARQSRLVLWVRSVTNELTVAAADVGVRGILRDKVSQDGLIASIGKIVAGEFWFEDCFIPGSNRGSSPRLTAREVEIVTFISSGLKNKAIAAAMNITEGTVKAHLKNLFSKTGVQSRLELAKLGVRTAGCVTVRPAMESFSQSLFQ